VAAAVPVLLLLGRFAFPRLVVVLPWLVAAFFVVERFLLLRGFSVMPVTASAMALAALDTPSTAASMLVSAGVRYRAENAFFFLPVHAVYLPC
jgi:hypothetical protein